MILPFVWPACIFLAGQRFVAAVSRQFHAGADESFYEVLRRMLHIQWLNEKKAI
jgi:hypothetical protein